jgi:hypothetical protein
MYVYKMRTKKTTVRLYGATALPLADAFDRCRELLQMKEPNVTDEQVVAFHQDEVSGPGSNGRGMEG